MESEIDELNNNSSMIVKVRLMPSNIQPMRLSSRLSLAASSVVAHIPSLLAYEMQPPSPFDIICNGVRHELPSTLYEYPYRRFPFASNR